jgi:hypothetical protein
VRAVFEIGGLVAVALLARGGDPQPLPPPDDPLLITAEAPVPRAAWPRAATDALLPPAPSADGIEHSLEVSGSSAAVAQAGSVVAGMSAGFRRCYNVGLRQEPGMRGSVNLTVKIGPDGEVLSVFPEATGLSTSVVACVGRRVASAVFAPPGNGGSTIIIPVTFVAE